MEEIINDLLKENDRLKKELDNLKKLIYDFVEEKLNE